MGKHAGRFGITMALAGALPTFAALSLPPGFQAKDLAVGLNPSTMAFAPDGRLFLCEKNGDLRILKGDSLLPTPFVSLSVDDYNERGLLGIAFDPGFAQNHYLYLYYTAKTPKPHNQVSRFTADGDQAAAGSQVDIFALDDLGAAGNHNGGALRFGKDGKLYVAAGNNANNANSQSLASTYGKILRLNPDGSIPSDNPFYATATGKGKAIWALGLRNPFCTAVQPGTGRFFINDVGEGTWEEIDDGLAGSNYGWPGTEGNTGTPPASPGTYQPPLYTYSHSDGCSITGGAFYPSPASPFPDSLAGQYLFGDYCGGWIRILDPAHPGQPKGFIKGITALVDIKVGPDGSLWYLDRGNNAGGADNNTGTDKGKVVRVTYTGRLAPSITRSPANLTVAAGQAAPFSVAATGAEPLHFRWQRNGQDAAGPDSATYRIAQVSAGDDQARFRAIVSNAYGADTSAEAILTVAKGQPPVASITAPADSAWYRAGDTIRFAGSGMDGGNPSPASALTWRVDFHHDTHLHPFLRDTSGFAAGSFVVPTIGETSPNVWYRIHLKVKGQGGLVDTVYRDVLPRKAKVTVATVPAGLQVRVDGQPYTAPYTFTGVVGIQRTLAVPSPQTLAGQAYAFSAWSDGGDSSHTLATPATDATYTVTFRTTGTALGPSPSPAPRLPAFAMWMGGMGGMGGEREIALPEGTWSLGVFDLEGRLVWAAKARGPSALRVPLGVGEGLFRLHWRPVTGR